MARARRGRDNDASTRYRHRIMDNFNRTITDFRRRTEEEHRHRVTLLHNDIDRRLRHALLRLARAIKPIYHPILRELMKRIPVRPLRREPPLTLIEKVIKGLPIGMYNESWLVSLSRHDYCHSIKNVTYFTPNTFQAVPEGMRLYDAITIDNSVNTTNPPPYNPDTQDMIMLVLNYIKPNEYYTITKDVGEVHDLNDNITILEGPSGEKLYTVPAYLYHYLNESYKPIRLLNSGRLEDVDVSTHCSLYFYPLRYKPRRNRNTMHKSVKLLGRHSPRIYYRNYNKRWYPNVA